MINIVKCFVDSLITCSVTGIWCFVYVFCYPTDVRWYSHLLLLVACTGSCPSLSMYIVVTRTWASVCRFRRRVSPVAMRAATRTWCASDIAHSFLCAVVRVRVQEDTIPFAATRLPVRCFGGRVNTTSRCLSAPDRRLHGIDSQVCVSYSLL